MDPTTGVDELIFGTILITAGTLVLYFRRAVTRMSVRHYQRMADMFPWLYAGRLLRSMKGEPFLRWPSVFTGLVLVANGIGFIVYWTYVATGRSPLLPRGKVGLPYRPALADRPRARNDHSSMCRAT